MPVQAAGEQLARQVGNYARATPGKPHARHIRDVRVTWWGDNGVTCLVCVTPSPKRRLSVPAYRARHSLTTEKLNSLTAMFLIVLVVSLILHRAGRRDNESIEIF